MKKKIALGLAAIVVVVGGIAAMSAYEAHVINVTAHIENALAVNAEALDFGTVFPQEYLTRDFTITLSESFMAEDRADDVEYVINQKTKCVCTAWTGEETGDCPEGQYAPLGWDTHICPDGYISMESLCPFLSKLPQDEDEDDTGVPSYFNEDNNECIRDNPEVGVAPATGRLAKSEGDTSDTWTVDLKVPPVYGTIGQDWPASCAEWTVPVDGTDYGCDLWIEVTDISRFDDSLLLENKDYAGDWHVIDDQTYGVLSYNASGDEFNYRFTAQNLVLPDVQYALIYYADKQDRFDHWGGDTIGKVIGTFIASDGSIDSGIMSTDLNTDLPHPDDWNAIADPDYCDGHNGFDDYDTCTGAKIWLVPTSDLTGDDSLPLDAWNPGNYLFETDLIHYTDL